MIASRFKSAVLIGLLSLAAHNAVVRSNDLPFVAADFNAMTNDQRRDFVLGMLESRDAALRNMKYKLSEEIVNLNTSDGTRKSMVKAEIELRRLDDSLWLKGVYRKPDDATAAPLIDVTVAWDGHANHGLSSPPTTNPTRPIVGRIDPTEADNFADTIYNDVLGLRADYMGSRRAPVFQWIKIAMEAGAKVELPPVEGNVTLISIKVILSEEDVRTYWLDYSRGFMISKAERQRRQKSGTQSPSLHEVLESKLVSGVWVPMQTIYHGSVTQGSSIQTERRFSISDFQIGTITPSDVEVEFPAGTKVADSVNNVLFTTTSDGKAKLQPYADMEAKELRVPPKGTVVDKVDDQTVKAYKSTPMILGQPATSGSSRFWWSVGILASILMGTLLTALFFRRRQKAAN